MRRTHLPIFTAVFCPGRGRLRPPRGRRRSNRIRPRLPPSSTAFSTTTSGSTPRPRPTSRPIPPTTARTWRRRRSSITPTTAKTSISPTTATTREPDKIKASVAARDTDPAGRLGLPQPGHLRRPAVPLRPLRQSARHPGGLQRRRAAEDYSDRCRLVFGRPDRPRRLHDRDPHPLQEHPLRPPRAGRRWASSSSAISAA